MWPTDANELIELRERLMTLVAGVKDRETITPPFDPSAPHPIPREVKERWWSLWLAVLDCVMAFDSIMSDHSKWIRKRRGVSRSNSFWLFLGAFLAQYRLALDFIAVVEKRPGLDPVLNDSVPEMSLPGGTYDAFKFRFLNVKIGTEFALLHAVAAAFRTGDHKGLNEVVEKDTSALWAMGVGDGAKLTAKNALAVIRKGAIRTWFPVQRGISLSLSHMRLPVRKSWLIRPRQVKSFLKRLQPGDILLQRREWAFTNLGLPGFWTHAAFYIGTRAERKIFEEDPETKSWLRREMNHSGGFEGYLSAKKPESYAKACSRLEDGHQARIIEALGPGVMLTSLQRSCSCDGVAVLRPRLNKVEKASAIIKAFGYLGRPYDFQFDFSTDSALVCSELVFKAYEPSAQMKGLTLPLVKMAGRFLTPPNTLARLYDMEAESEQRQFDLVMFIDGNEGTRKASESDEATFRSSWKRPKWHVFNQWLIEKQENKQNRYVLEKPIMERVTLREMVENDLPILFEHQRDPLAVEMAAFPAREKKKFMALWTKALGDKNIIKTTILAGSEVAGYAVCWEKGGRALMGYWLGSRFWGRGIGSRALSEFVAGLRIRPVYAYVAKRNKGSIRILEKCGFVVSDEKGTKSVPGDDGVEELIYVLKG